MIQQREIRINLLNYKLEGQTAQKRIFLKWGAYAAVAIILLGAICGLSLVKRDQIAALQKENQHLQSALKQTNSQTASLLSKEKIEEQITARKKLVYKVGKAQNTSGPVLEKVGEMDIPGILLINIDVRPGKVTFKGLSGGHSSMVELLAWLRDTEPFGDISDLTYNGNEETGEISFSIVLSLEVNE